MVGLLGALVLTGGAVGCAAEQGVDEDMQNEAETLASTESPNTLTFAKVTANGTGCPAGTWESVPSKDGTHYSLKFKSFAGKVDREKTIAVADCQLGITMNTPEDSSIALESFKIGGWASLSRGTSGVVLTTAYFQGNPKPAADTKHEFTGPRLTRLGISADTEADELVWSPCGKERNLNVRTTVRVKGDGQHRGTVTIDQLENLKFAVKKCGETPTDPDKPDEGDNQPDPNGPGIASVSANGTGCPEGTSHVTIAPDGLSARIDYTKFTAAVDKNKSVDVKNCQLGITLRNQDKFEYKVNSKVDGYAVLNEGQSAKVLQKAYLQGQPTVDAVEIAGTLAGPFDDSFNSGLETITRCSAARELNVNTTVSLSDSGQKKDAYVDFTGGDAQVTSGQVITVSGTPCE